MATVYSGGQGSSPRFRRHRRAPKRPLNTRRPSGYDRRQLPPESLPSSQLEHDRGITDSERDVAGFLTDADIAFEREVHRYETGLEGQGMTEFVPDFYLLEFDLEIEVTEDELGAETEATQGRTRRPVSKKRRKIAAVEARYEGVTIILIADAELRLLRSRVETIRSFIMAAIERQMDGAEARRLTEDAA